MFLLPDEKGEKRIGRTGSKDDDDDDRAILHPKKMAANNFRHGRFLLRF